MFRAATYNILNGGQDKSNFSRFELITEIIRDIRPDVLVIQEAMRFSDDGNLAMHRFERETGLRGFLAVAASGQHVAVFLNPRLQVLATSYDVTHFHHAAVFVSVLTQEQERLSIVGTHLCPYGEDNRLPEALYLANYARERELVLLLGDMNSLSPHERHSRNIRALAPRYRARYLLACEGHKPATNVVRVLERASFIDLWWQDRQSAPGYTAPTPLAKGREFSHMRVDYIFATERLAKTLVECAVVRNRKTDRASDHYPVYADLNITMG